MRNGGQVLFDADMNFPIAVKALKVIHAGRDKAKILLCNLIDV